jgi:hypothetical protein
MDYDKTKRKHLSTALLLSLALLSAVIVCLKLARTVRADNITWDGGGLTNNWSEAANWTNNTKPSTSDSVFFDGTSTKDCVIDENISVNGLWINAGYTGTVTQSGNTTITVGSGEFRQASGIFNGGTGDIDVNAPFSLSGGSFNSTTGTLFLGGPYSHSAGTFNHNNGTVTFDATGGALSIAVPDTFNNVNYSKNNGVSMSVSGPADGSAFKVLGTLSLNDGQMFGGSIEADGDVTVGPDFDAAPDELNPATLIIAGAATRTITWAAGVRLLNVTLNGPNVTLQTSGAGTLTWRALTLQNGTINQGGVNFDVRNNYSQSGGIFNASANTINFRNPYAQTGGTFNGGSGNIDVDSSFSLTGASSVFKSTSGTLFVAAAFSHSSGAFNHNGGTLTIDGGAAMTISQANETFKNLTFDPGAGISKTLFGPGGGNAIFKVLGTLNLNSGTIFGGDPIEAQGDVTIGASFGGGVSQPIIFSGSANQTYTNNGGVNPNVTWTLNKPSGTVNLASNMDLSNGSGNLVLTSGTITTANFKVNVGTGSVTRTSAYIVGNLQRSYTSLGTKVFDVGTANGYSPVSANVTTLTQNPSSLTIGATQGGHPLFDPNHSLGRYFPITETGDVTATITFNYFQTDVNGSENSYRVIKVENGAANVTVPNATIDTTANTFTITGLTNFSDWTLAEPPPATLAFNVQPSNTEINQTMTPSVKVEVRDQFGSIIPFATNSVTLSLSGGSGGAMLSGTVSRNAVNGVATFNDLSVNTIGAGYTLLASSTGLASATSNPFQIFGPFVVTNINASGPGSLAQVITNANTTPGTQTISFNIPGGGPFIISPTALSDIVDPVVIDGTTQPGYSGQPIVQVLASLTISAGNSTIKGLVIGSIFLATNGGNTIQGNYIGTNINGDASENLPYFFSLYVASSNNQIGGSAPVARNVISGNPFAYGILIASGSGNVIQGNYVGTNAAGTAALPNGGGIGIFAGFPTSTTSTIVGGSLPGEGNLISGNTNYGLYASGSGHVIRGNRIGTDVTGTSAIPNSYGIEIDNLSFQYGATDITVGGIAPGEANTIAFNTYYGISLWDFAYGQIPSMKVERIVMRGNSIFSNGWKGISLDAWANDAQDPDGGANTRQNNPVLISADSSGGTTTVHGTLNSTPSSQFTLDFYSNTECGFAAFNPQGKTYLGSASVTTDSTGIAGFVATLPIGTPAGQFITATATDAFGNTSDFSHCRSVPSVISVSGHVTDNTGAPIPQAFIGAWEYRTCDSIEYSYRYITADNNGSYSVNNLTGGGCSSVFPYYPDYDFTPGSYSYQPLSNNQTNQNFVGTKTRYSVRGTVKSLHPHGAYPIANVLMTLDGPNFVHRVAITDNNGFYRFSDLNAGTYTLDPPATLALTPANRSITIQTADVSGQDFSTTAQLQGRLLVSSGAKIYAMNADASAIVEIGDGSFGSFSPDGQRVVFSLSDSQIYKMNADGSNRLLLASGNIGSMIVKRRYPVWSPDGTKIVFVQDARPARLSGPTTSSLMIMNADGTSPAALFSETTNSPDNISSPSWSPDGTKLVLVKRSGSTTDIFTINANGTNLHSFTGGINGYYSYPVWSPNGNRVAFLKRSSQTSSSANLFVGNANGSNFTAIATGLTLGRPAWSPESGTVAFLRLVANTRATHQIVMIDATGAGGETILTPTIAGARSLSWGNRVDIPTPQGFLVNVATGSVQVSGAVATAGTTTITSIPPNSAGAAPANFVIDGMAYEITTTATYFPPLQVCFSVPLSVDSDHFMQLSLLHSENGVLVDRTTSRDFPNHIICGSVDSFSPFVLAEQIDNAKPLIIGFIRDANGNPLSDVSVQLTGAENATTSSDSAGKFSFVNLTAGGNYNVQPSLLRHVFTESNHDFVNVSGKNQIVFTGTQTNFTISGKVNDTNGNGVSGVEVTLEGDATGTALTDAAGNYSFSQLPAGGTFTITPNRSDLTFSPGQTTIAPLMGDVNQLDFNSVTSECAVAITSEPIEQTLCSAGSANFSVSASGNQLNYTWRKNGVPLTNGGNISGANTATLTINLVSAGDLGSYDVIVSGTCGASVSNPVSLSLGSFTLSSTMQTFPSTGGSASVNITNANSCPWTAVSNDSFIHITAGSSGMGNGTVNFSVDATTSDRIGTITIAGATFTAIQLAPANPNAPFIFTEGGTTRAIALDSVTFVGGPFRILTDHNFSEDHHTRVILFTSNLGLTQPNPSVLTVQAAGINLAVENVGPVTGVNGLDVSYIVVRLADGLPSGDLPLTITLNGNISNLAVLTISP